MTLNMQLLQEIESFLRSTGMAATTFGQRSARDWQLVNRLRCGGTVTLTKVDRVRSFMADERRRHVTKNGHAA